jgi:hypothetical protein
MDPHVLRAYDGRGRMTRVGGRGLDSVDPHADFTASWPLVDPPPTGIILAWRQSQRHGLFSVTKASKPSSENSLGERLATLSRSAQTTLLSGAVVAP